MSSIEQRARELLAAEYEQDSCSFTARTILSNPERLGGDIERALSAIKAALRLSAGAEVDWRAQYRLQTAMRYMDNAPRLTLSEAYKMADHDVRGLELAAAPRHEPGEVQP